MHVSRGCANLYLHVKNFQLYVRMEFFSTFSLFHAFQLSAIFFSINIPDNGGYGVLV